MSATLAKASQNNKHYTYADYITWESDTRYEIIDGIPYAMAGASQVHQEISGELFSQLHAFLKGKQCKVFAAPFDVRLNPDSYDDTVVQPDLIVVCNKSKLDGKCCNGAPDMAIEIISPSTAGRDRLIKFNKYLKAGVKEYWIVEPESRTVSVNILKGTAYMASVYGEEDLAPISVLEGCKINLNDVFAG